MAPVVGPLLDRVRPGGGTRSAATRLAGRCCAGSWRARSSTRAGALSGRVRLPGAAPRRTRVTRSAAVPRLLPPGVTLVSANAGISLAGIVAAAVAAVVAVGLALTARSWALRLAVPRLPGGAVLAIRLPAAGGLVRGRGAGGPALGGEARAAGGAPRVGAHRWCPRCGRTRALRGLSGFLTLFLAFLLRQQPIGGLEGHRRDRPGRRGGRAGNMAGHGDRRPAARSSPSRSPARSARSAAVGAGRTGRRSVVLVRCWRSRCAAGLASALGQALAGRADPAGHARTVRASAFARSETLLQLAWVVGGGLGHRAAARGDLGLGFAAGGLVVGLVAAQRVRPEPPPA